VIADTASPARAGAGLDRRAMGVLAAGHGCADMCQGAVPALLPFLVAQRGWSFAAASTLVLAATLASSVVQPLFGLLSDRHPRPWLMPAGLLAAGGGLALVGVAPGLPGALAVVLLSGLGVAAFHPEGSRSANYAAGARRATGMSLFAVGGNAGWALGPVLVTALVVPFGLSGTLLLVVPPALVALVVGRELPRLRAMRAAVTGARRAAAAAAPRAHVDEWGAFAKLGGLVAARSVLYFGLMTFVPLYFVHDLGRSAALGNAAITVMLAAGAVGTLLGGRLADRIGRRPVVVGSLALQAPLLVAMLSLPAEPAIALLGLIGLTVIATFSITVVMGQEYLPSRLGVASGVTLGLAIGIGGLGAVALGPLADALGPKAALEALVAVVPVALALGLWLPRQAGDLPLRRRLAAAAAPGRGR
jgi:FSR family fosmidomycin resistance protein-like MFS transporter